MDRALLALNERMSATNVQRYRCYYEVEVDRWEGQYELRGMWPTIAALMNGGLPFTIWLGALGNGAMKKGYQLTSKTLSFNELQFVKDVREGSQLPNVLVQMVLDYCYADFNFYAIEMTASDAVRRCYMLTDHHYVHLKQLEILSAVDLFAMAHRPAYQVPNILCLDIAIDRHIHWAPIDLTGDDEKPAKRKCT